MKMTKVENNAKEEMLLKLSNGQRNKDSLKNIVSHMLVMLLLHVQEISQPAKDTKPKNFVLPQQQKELKEKF